MEEVSLRHAEVSKALGNGWRWCETWEPGISLAWKIGLVLCWWWSVQRQRVTGIWICAGIFTCWCAYFEEEGEQKAPRKVWERSEKWMGEILEYLRRREWVSASLDAYRNVSDATASAIESGSCHKRRTFRSGHCSSQRAVSVGNVASFGNSEQSLL